MESVAREFPSPILHPQSSLRLDRWFWLAILITAVVVIPRSISIANAHCESYDDQYHLIRGLALLTREPLPNAGYDNPPFAEILSAIPLWVSGCRLGGREHDPLLKSVGLMPLDAILYGQPLSPETLLVLVGLWKAILFLPGAAALFLWCRRLYGLQSAWLALAMVLIDPSIAAHTPTAATDVLAVEAILIACYCTWRYFEEPTRRRVVAVSVSIAAALAMKHTCIIVLPVGVIYALLHWRQVRRQARIAGAVAPNAVAIARGRILWILLLIPLFVWMFNAFDVSKPRDHCELVRATYTAHWSFAVDVVNANLARHWPAGVHIASILDAIEHAREGHLNYLFGQVSRSGWWYYQPVVAAFKVPLGFFVVGLMGLASFIWRRPRREEISILVPMILYWLFIFTSTLNIGFRHALPGYVLLLMLAGRVLADHAPKVLRMVCWLAVLIAAIDVARWHPDELAYINGPWKSAPRIISDSNLDWGQSLKQVRQWIDAQPAEIRSKPIYLAYFGDEWAGRAIVKHYLDDRARQLEGNPPDHGFLIVSPVLIWGAFAPPEQFAALRSREPVAIIGHSMQVYDLDQK